MRTAINLNVANDSCELGMQSDASNSSEMQMKFKTLKKCFNAEGFCFIKVIKSLIYHRLFSINPQTNTQQKLWKWKSIKIAICGGDKLVNLTPENDEEQWSKNNRITFNCNEQLHWNSSKRSVFSENQQIKLKQIRVAFFASWLFLSF